MIRVLLTVVLAAGGAVAVRQSTFDASEMSSDTVYMAVGTCIAQQGAATTEALFKCGCAVDAMRYNFKVSKGGWGTVTPEQGAKCAEPMPKPQQQKQRQPLRPQPNNGQ